MKGNFYYFKCFVLMCAAAGWLFFLGVMLAEPGAVVLRALNDPQVSISGVEGARLAVTTPFVAAFWGLGWVAFKWAERRLVQCVDDHIASK